MGFSGVEGRQNFVDTHFIDEGFGSLDADTVDVAVDALKTLRGQGRRVGSPEYLNKHPRPEHPRDLARNIGIRYRFPSGKMFNWRFERDGEAIEVEVDGPITLDDQQLMIEVAAKGGGLANVWEDRARPYLDAGTLGLCLEAWCPVKGDLFLYYPSRRHVSGGLRVLIDRMRI